MLRKLREKLKKDEYCSHSTNFNQTDEYKRFYSASAGETECHLSPVNVHVLGAVPLGVVRVPVPNLPNELIVRRVTPDEVVCAPPEGLGVPLGQSGGVISLL